MPSAGVPSPLLIQPTFSPQINPDKNVALTTTPSAVPLASRQFVQPEFSLQANLLFASILDCANAGNGSRAAAMTAEYAMRFIAALLSRTRSSPMDWSS